MKLAQVPHVHIIPIEALEYLLGMCEGASLYDWVAKKRLNPADDRMDFSDWLSHQLGDRPRANAYLSSKYIEFSEGFGIDDPLREGE